MVRFQHALLVVALVAGNAMAGDVVIGASAALRGPSRGLGIELLRGSMACLAGVNERGGVQGRTIVLEAYDDGYEPVPAIRNTVRLVEEDNVFLLFGYVGTPTVARTLPLLAKYAERDVMLFFPFTGAQPHREPPYDRHVYNLRASYRQETQGLVDHLVAVGRKRIAVFYQVDAYGRSGQDGVKRALAGHGLSIVGEATYFRGTPFDDSMDEQVRILRRAAPDAVVSIGAYAACAAFVRDARLAGWDVPIANVSFVGSENLLALLLQAQEHLGRKLTGSLVNSQVVPSYEDLSLPAVREYREAIERHGDALPAGMADPGYEALPFSYVSFEGFLNAKLLVEVLRRADLTAGRRGLREAVEGIRDLDLGIGTPISFGPGRHQGLDEVYYTTVDEGRFVPITDWDVWRKR